MLPMSHQRTRRYLRLQRADISQNRGESGGVPARCDTISGVAFDASEDADARSAAPATAGCGGADVAGGTALRLNIGGQTPDLAPPDNRQRQKRKRGTTMNRGQWAALIGGTALGLTAIAATIILARREAREAAQEWYQQYGTPVVDQAKQISKQVRDAAVEQYNTQAPKAMDAVNKVVPQARERLSAILPGQRGSEDLSAVIPGSNGTVEGMMSDGE